MDLEKMEKFFCASEKTVKCAIYGPCACARRLVPPVQRTFANVPNYADPAFHPQAFTERLKISVAGGPIR
jgi:hypothetical protein